MATTWKEKVVVASIDFGTTYSGFAISFVHDYNDENPNVLVPEWKHGETRGTSKTTTCVLLDPKYNFHSFGYEAEEKYAELAEEDEHKEWHMFRRFKMRLYQNKESHRLNSNDKINDTSGRPYPAINVFSHAIKYMKDEIIKYVAEKTSILQEENIYYVLTTPAIWSQQAKAFMRKAARNAKIPDDNLCIALEPECAAVYLQRSHLPALDIMSGGKTAMKTGSCHLVVDLGGGTTDIVGHRVNDAGNFEEIIPPCGGPFGSDRINMEFENFLIKLSGGKVFDLFQSSHMDDFLTLQRRFEQKKCSYKVSDDSAKKDSSPSISIDIPLGYLDLHKKYNQENLSDSCRQTAMADDVSFKTTKMRIRQSFFNTIFKETIDGAVGLVEKAVKRSEYKIDTIFCTGGFSDCDYLKKTMKQAFPRHTVVTSIEAVNDVLKGAAIFGRNQDVMNKRMSPFTFGIDWNEDFDSDKHPIEKKQQTEYGYVCTDIFKILVKKGDLVQYNVPAEEFDAYTTFRYQESLELPFYRSEMSDEPKFVTDLGCHRMGSISVKTSGSKDYEHVKVKVYFGSTEIKVEATDVQNRKFEVMMNFSETEV